MTHRETERRYSPGVVELRGSGDQRTITGYAAKFKKLSRDLGGFREQIDAGAFAKSQSDGYPDVVARYNHSDDFLLGTVGAGTLRLDIDKTGLRYDVDPPNARQDIVELIQRGDVRQSSFAFHVYEDDFERTRSGDLIRTLVSVRLLDVAPVVTPAYPDTTSALRSLANKFDAPLEEVRSLIEAGNVNRLFERTDRPSLERSVITELRRDLLAKKTPTF